MARYPLDTTAVNSEESKPRKSRPFCVVTGEGWPAAVCVLTAK